MANRLMITHTVGESLLHIIYPVADQALKHVIDTLGYHDLFGDRIDVGTEFREWSKTTTDDGRAMVRSNRVRAKLNPNVNPSTIKWEGSGTQTDLANGNMVIGNHNGRNASRLPWDHGNHIPDRHYSVFCDPECDINLSCRSVGSSLSMEVTMEFDNEILANEAISRIYQCFHNGDMINYVDVMYDYPLPKDFETILAYLYSLKGKRSETDTALQWLRDGSDNAITLMVNRNRPEHKEIVISKNNFQALYLIECSQETPTKLDPKGASVTFNLTIQYARSNRFVLEYPIIVNNKYISPDYVPLERKLRAAGPVSMVMWDNPAVSQYWYENLKPHAPANPVMFPFWDNWVVPRMSRPSQCGYLPILIAAFTLDNIDDPQQYTQFDIIDDMASVIKTKLDDSVIENIMRYRNGVFGADKFVNIAVYADDICVETSKLDISNGHLLKIKCKDPKPIYRLVFSINPDLYRTQQAYEACHDGVAQADTQYYVMVDGKLEAIKTEVWESLESIRINRGAVYKVFDQDEAIYDPCYDQTAQEDQLYFVIIDDKYTILRVNPGDDLTPARTQYGQIFKRRDRLSGSVRVICDTQYANSTDSYCILIGSIYKDIFPKDGESLDAYRIKYATYTLSTATVAVAGVTYCVKVDGEWVVLNVEPGDSLEQYRTQYGEIYERELASIFTTRELISIAQNGYAWNKVFVARITTSRNKEG